MLTHVKEVKESKEIENKGEYLILGNDKIEIMDAHDFFFTTNSNIKFMETLDSISNQYGLSLINDLGPHLIGENKNMAYMNISIYIRSLL